MITVQMLKTDNGFNATVSNNYATSIPNGKNIFNRGFKSFGTGDVFEATFNTSPAGRLMLRSTKLLTRCTSPAKKHSQKVETEPVKTNAPVSSKKTVTVTETRDALAGYFISQDARLVFNTAKSMSDGRPERAVKVMMIGPSGYGKTTLPKLFADLTGKKFMRMNCATIRDPEEWFGYREAREGSTVFVRSEFGKMMEEGNAVVVLDEFNRLEPWLHNTLFPLLDDDGCTVVHDETFRIGQGVIVVGTINTGYKYTGTFELDEALLNRFDFLLEVGPMPHPEEVKVLTERVGVKKSDAEKIVKTANILRQSSIVCSTRTSLNIAMMVKAGMTLREAYETAVVRRLPADSNGSSLRKQVIDLVNVQLGAYEPRELTRDIFTITITKEVEEVEQEAVETNAVKKTYIELSASGTKGLQFVRLVRLLRELKLPDGKTMSLGDAQPLAGRINAGEKVIFEVDYVREDALSIGVEFADAGVSGRFFSR